MMALSCLSHQNCTMLVFLSFMGSFDASKARGLSTLQMFNFESRIIPKLLVEKGLKFV